MSMGANAATKLMQVCDNVLRVMGIEWMAAAQALEFRRPAQTSPVLEAKLAEFRKRVPFVENDCVMSELIEESIGFVKGL